MLDFSGKDYECADCARYNHCERTLCPGYAPGREEREDAEERRAEFLMGEREAEERT